MNIKMTDEEKELLAPRYLEYIEARNELKRKRDADIQTIVLEDLDEADKKIKIAAIQKEYDNKRRIAYKNLYYKYTSIYHNIQCKSKRKYYYSNREVILKYQKEYRENELIKERKSVYLENYYEENSPTISQKRKKYYTDNKEKISERTKIYREKNKANIKEKRRAYYLKNKK
jgi:hypothetical protein